MLLTNLAAVVLNLVVFACGMPQKGAGEGDQGGAPDKSRAALDAWLRRFPNVPRTKEEGLTVVAVADEVVRRVFPHDRFYGVYFYVGQPHPKTLPAGLRTRNLIRVQDGGAVERIADREALKAIFEKHLPRSREEAQVREAAAACVRVAEEFFQDGLYQFHEPEAKVTRRGDDLVATGEARVKSRGTGTVSVTLTFKPSGEPGRVDIVGRVRPDVRLR
jgi:hypothetical protein